jgi:Mlc titration factor MtfA (ptsG expression regulator)
MGTLIGVVIVAAIMIFLFRSQKKPRPKYTGTVPQEWKIILEEKVFFYTQLTQEEKEQFEKRIQHFLNTTRITGIKTTIDLTDRLLVASSAIIPVFAFPGWEYLNLKEVLIYPGAFDQKYQFGTESSNILGMVGSGLLEGKMILSKSSLHAGFSNEKDKLNVGIHEFVHLIDKSDGQVDGIPALLQNKQYVIPWLDMVRKNMEEIHRANSDINPYGGVNQEEFFSVISEYFFKQPRLLEHKHPELYHQLSDIFKTDLAKKYGIKPLNRETGRNDPCPCGSGKKFKDCCGKIVGSQVTI